MLEARVPIPTPEVHGASGERCLIACDRAIEVIKVIKVIDNGNGNGKGDALM